MKTQIVQFSWYVLPHTYYYRMAFTYYVCTDQI
jgi:hypothetical protein